ncbi:MAG: hypothetical protein Q8P13_04225 [bacterium]|nr:hypothetical protein [bacterium]
MKIHNFYLILLFTSFFFLLASFIPKKVLANNTVTATVQIRPPAKSSVELPGSKLDEKTFVSHETGLLNKSGWKSSILQYGQLSPEALEVRKQTIYLKSLLNYFIAGP